ELSGASLNTLLFLLYFLLLQKVFSTNIHSSDFDFIMKCQAQIDLHRLSGTSLNTLGWKTVEDELNNMQSFHVLKHKELKNQWDYLKKQWQVWRGLINWTGHGYDPVSGTFDWPEEVWENIIMVNSEAKKFKAAHLQHRDLLGNYLRVYLPLGILHGL
ncbi:hypothetical protein GIB67_023265, partial [Kingdonia uniflora]